MKGNINLFQMAFVDFGGMMCSDVLPQTGLMVRVVVRLTNIFLASINVFYLPSAVLYWILRTHMELQGMFKTKRTGLEAGIGTYFSTEIIHLIFVMLCQTFVFFFLLILVDSVKFRHAVSTVKFKIFTQSFAQLQSKVSSADFESALQTLLRSFKGT